MGTKSKIILITLAALLALAAGEQLKAIQCCFSRASSTTRTVDAIKPRAGDLVSTVRVVKPIGRWLPFIKFDETVHFHTYQRVNGADTVVERTATTRTSVVVIGLCSTAKYDKLASQPFEAVHKEYNKLWQGHGP